MNVHIHTSPVPVIAAVLPFAYRDGTDMYGGIMRFLRETGTDWELLVFRETTGGWPVSPETHENVSGVIVGPSGIPEENPTLSDMLEDCLNFCRNGKIPLVGLDWPLQKLGKKRSRLCSFLNIDSSRIGSFAAEILPKAGPFASYGFVSLHPQVAWSRDREISFVRALRGAGQTGIRRFPGNPIENQPRFVDWLRNLGKPSALFAANDDTADFILKTCRRNAIRVPDDIAVLGVDDDPVFCVHTRPTLSSIHPDFAELGYCAAKELDALMNGRSSGRMLTVSGALTVTNRMSTAPSSPAGALVRRADEIIAEGACRKLDSDAIASRLKISRRLLDLRYRQLTGRSVRETIVLRRVEKAEQLLSYSGHSIGTVCRLCGYRSESYFDRIFRAHEGVTMGEFRLAALKTK